MAHGGFMKSEILKSIRNLCNAQLTLCDPSKMKMSPLYDRLVKVFNGSPSHPAISTEFLAASVSTFRASLNFAELRRSTY